MSASEIARLQRAVAVARRMAGGAWFSRTGKFVTSAPSAQTAIDAVPDAWASQLPAPLEHAHAGRAELFADPRISWAFAQLGGVDGSSVLDLGPLEGAHSYMAEQAGAARVVGVEANRMAFLKCLVTKEILELRRCSFLCGDASQYLLATPERFDVCIACGILYHMVEPVRLLDLISRVASRLIVWTHVHDDAAAANTNLSGRLSGPHRVEYAGFGHEVYRHSYSFDHRLNGFFGGTQPYSHWLPRQELMRALEHFGWTRIEVAFDEPLHPNGPALALVAQRA